MKSLTGKLRPLATFGRPGSPSLLRDGAWTLIVNLLTKAQAMALIVSAALIGGVVDVGRLSAAVAAASLGAGLADFGFSYECGRLLAAQPWHDGMSAVYRQMAPRIIAGGILTVLSFYVTVGHRALVLDANLYAAITMLGAAITCSQISMQGLNALNRFREAAAILGGMRFASAVLSIVIAWFSGSVILILLGLTVAELISAAMLTVALVRTGRALPASGQALKLGHGHVWLGVGNTINALVNRSDVLLVGAMASPMALGIYSIASQLANGIESLAAAPAAPLAIYIARAKSSGETVSDYIRQTRKTTFRLGIFGAVGVILAYLIFTTVAHTATGEIRTYSAGFTIVVCVLSGIAAAEAGVHLLALVGLRRYALVGIIRLVNGIITIAAFLVLTPLFGAPGAAAAAAVRDGSLCLLSLFVAERLSARVGNSNGISPQPRSTKHHSE